MPDNKFTKQNGQLERKIDLTGQKEFYREGANIFDASNERRITLPDWKKDWTGRATEIDSPQAIAPRQPIASEQQQPSQSDTMAMLMTGILNKAQGASYKDLLTKKRGLQREVLDRQTGETPESLRGNLSFAEMQGLSDRKASALSSDIDRNQAEIQEFELLMDKAKSISEDFAKNMKAPESIMNNYIKAFEEAPQTFDKLISTMNEKTFQDFIGRIDFKKLAEPKAELKPTSGIQEYQFAQQQGFTGSFLDFERDMSAAGRAPKGGGGDTTPFSNKTQADVDAIKESIKTNGLNATLIYAQDEDEIKFIKSIATEVGKESSKINIPTDFANKKADIFLSDTTNFSDDKVLEYMDKKKDDYKKVFKSRETEQANMKKDIQDWKDNYKKTIESQINSQIEQYREIGYNDEEIMKKL